MELRTSSRQLFHQKQIDNERDQYTGITTGEESFIPEYDLDGNQTRIKTSTGIWTADYNAQNRPARFTRENTDGTRTVITAAYDYLGRRAWKKVETIATDVETGEETATVTLHQRYIYRGYLQVAACDLTRGGHPCLWLITWDPTQPIETRPLAIQKDGTWYAYGWDLTKNICEVFGQAGYIRTTYSYTPYGTVTANGDIAQPLQWSSEYVDPELGLVYYNYRYYNPTDGRWIRRDPVIHKESALMYKYIHNNPPIYTDLFGLTDQCDNISHEDMVDCLDIYIGTKVRYLIFLSKSKEWLPGKENSIQSGDEFYQYPSLIIKTTWKDSVCCNVIKKCFYQRRESVLLQVTHYEYDGTTRFHETLPKVYIHTLLGIPSESEISMANMVGNNSIGIGSVVWGLGLRTKSIRIDISLGYVSIVNQMYYL